MYVCISPPAVATRRSDGEKTASFTDPAHVEPFHSSLSTDGTQKRISMHSYIHTDSTFAYPVLHNVLYNTIYRRIFPGPFSLHWPSLS